MDVVDPGEQSEFASRNLAIFYTGLYRALMVNKLYHRIIFCLYYGRKYFFLLILVTCLLPYILSAMDELSLELSFSFQKRKNLYCICDRL